MLKKLKNYQAKRNQLMKDAERQKGVIEKSSESRQKQVEEISLDEKVASVAFSKRHLGSVAQERKEVDSLALMVDSMKRLERAIKEEGDKILGIVKEKMTACVDREEKKHEDLNKDLISKRTEVMALEKIVTQAQGKARTCRGHLLNLRNMDGVKLSMIVEKPELFLSELSPPVVEALGITDEIEKIKAELEREAEKEKIAAKKDTEKRRKQYAEDVKEAQHLLSRYKEGKREGLLKDFTCLLDVPTIVRLIKRRGEAI